MQTQKPWSEMTEKEKYNHDVRLTTKSLGITRATYNTFRHIGRKLRKLYEDQCNGFADSMGNWDQAASDLADRKEEKLNKWAMNLAKEHGLYIYFQTDPRGATIYLSKNPIPENDYNRAAHCIY